MLEPQTEIVLPRQPGVFKSSVRVIADLALLALLFLTILLIIALTVTLALDYSRMQQMFSGGDFNTIIVLSMASLYGAILGLYWLRGRAIQLPQAPADHCYLVQWALGAGVLVFLGNAGIAALLKYTVDDSEPLNQKLIIEAAKQSPVLLTILITVCAPVFEELLFRKQLFGRLAAAGHLKLAFVASSLLFALMHEPSPTQGFLQWILALCLYGALGAAFAWIYWRYGRIWMAMLAHAVNNGIAAALLFGLA